MASVESFFTDHPPDRAALEGDWREPVFNTENAMYS